MQKTASVHDGKGRRKRKESSCWLALIWPRKFCIVGIDKTEAMSTS